LKLLEYGRSCYCKGDSNLEKLWPNSWYNAIKILDMIGYTEPIQYFPCLDVSHKTCWFLLKSQNEKCLRCNNPPSPELTFYYLDLTSKMKRWFSSADMCKKMLGHWFHKDDWFLRDPSTCHIPISEMWDGTRFAEISYFFNPDAKYQLPSLCTSCSSILSVEEILNGDICTINSSIVVCQSCSISQEVEYKFTYGNPRNIVLMVHYDGWQYGNSGVHGGGSIELSICNMTKSDRNHVKEVYVSTFIPVKALPKDRSCKLDPFLSPLIEELKKLYINGVEIDYPYSTEGVSNGKSVVRAMLILWTGDLPAQCEVGKFIFAGKHGCRRDELKGCIYPGSTRYYYVGNRHMMRFPFKNRDVESDFDLMKDIEKEERISVKHNKSKESGYTGVSILDQLRPLHSFNICFDLVFDVMHNISLNVVKKQLDNLVSNQNLPGEVVDEKMSKICWTPELKDGRIPEQFSTRRSFWKAEEFQKFAFPVMETVLGGLVQDKDYHLTQLLSRIVEFIFYHRSGWTAEELNLFDNIVKRYLVLLEEWSGEKQCVITSHNLIHFVDDIKRFGLSANYWCWYFERCVNVYTKRASNHKNAELSFARAECRREALKFSAAIKIKKQKFRISVNKMSTSSLQGARHLTDVYSNWKFPRGITVGGLSNNVELLDPRDMVLLEQALGCSLDGRVSTFRSIFMPNHRYNGMLYRCKEVIAFVIPEAAESIGVIESVFALQVNGKQRHILKMNVYPFILINNEVAVDKYSGYRSVDISSPVEVYISSSKILRKVMLLKHTYIESEALVIDMYRSTIPISFVLVPCYIQEGDFINVNGEAENFYAKVLSSDKKNKKATVQIYQNKDSDLQKFYVSSFKNETISWDSVLLVLDGSFVNLNGEDVFVKDL